MFVVSQIFRFKKERSGASVVVSVLLVIGGLKLLSYLRINAMMVLVAFIIVFLFIKFAFAFKWTTLTLAVLALMMRPLCDKVITVLRSKAVSMLNYHLGLNYNGGFTFKILPDRYYAYLMSSGAVTADIYDKRDFIMALLSGFKIFLLEPSPFVINKLQQVIVLPAMIVWYIILIFAVFGVYRCLKSISAEKLSLIALALIFSFSIGLSEANYETLIRHRDMIVPVYIVLAAYGMSGVGIHKKYRKA
jgi:hypothetical protein